MARPHILTARGQAQVDTAQQKFGTGSMLLDGDGDWIDTPDDADFAFGANDFTMEAFVRFATSDNVPRLFFNQRGGAGTAAFSFYFDGPVADQTQINLAFTSDGTNFTTVTRSWTPSDATWYHVALARDGANLRFFVDGTQVGTTYDISTTSIFNSTQVFCVGGNSAVANSVNGWMDEIRVSNNARYTANFTPSASAFTSDANTLLLVHCDGTDESTTFTDDDSAGGGAANHWLLMGV